MLPYAANKEKKKKKHVANLKKLKIKVPVFE